MFRKPEGYAAFQDLLHKATTWGAGLLPDAESLSPSPVAQADGDLSRFMQGLLTAHVWRHHRHYQSSGHVWQGRFKAFPIQQDGHLLTVLRYIERNPLRAKLATRAQDWLWSSLRERDASAGWLQPIPVGSDRLDGLDQCTHDGRGGGGGASPCEPGNAVWGRAVGAADSTPSGTGGNPQTQRAATDTRGKVECPLLLLSFTPLFYSFLAPFRTYLAPFRTYVRANANPTLGGADAHEAVRRSPRPAPRVVQWSCRTAGFRPALHQHEPLLGRAH